MFTFKKIKVQLGVVKKPAIVDLHLIPYFPHPPPTKENFFPSM
jgi:hypothetical protein